MSADLIVDLLEILAKISLAAGGISILLYIVQCFDRPRWNDWIDLTLLTGTCILLFFVDNFWPIYALTLLMTVENIVFAYRWRHEKLYWKVGSIAIITLCLFYLEYYGGLLLSAG